MEDKMKHLPLSAVGALLLAGSMAVYAQAQQPPKEPMTEEQKPAQGSRQQQPQSKEGQGEAIKSGQSGQSEDKNSQDRQRSERTEKSTPESTGKQGSDKAGSGGSAAQEGQRAQGGDRSKGESQEQRSGKKLEAKQRTVVKETIVKRNVRPVKVNFSINVGAVVPRTVTLYDLPPVLIEYEPSYSRYKFILADDDTILVIDPETWTIVDVIDV
jgi:type IV secretory pathway VirB10-like protein